MTNTLPFKAVIYDMDGLLIDTEPFWRKAEMKVFSTVGIHLTEQDCIQTMGYRFDEVVDYWWNKKPWEGKTKQQIYDEVLDEMEAIIRHQAKPMKGVVKSLEYFKSKGMRLTLASSSAMQLITITVDKLHIVSYFELLVSAEHEMYGKPHPAVFLRTAEMLSERTPSENLRPENCLVIEDSFTGLLAAKSAKMACAIVPEPCNFNDPRFVIADWKLRSLEEVDMIL